MARHHRSPPPPVGNPDDPQGMAVLLAKFLEWMRVKNFSEETVVGRHYMLTPFILWAEERGVVRPCEVTKPILERFQRYLYHYRKKNGDPISFRTQHGFLTPLRAWFKWLTRNNHILYNPASEIELPKLEARLPKHVLTSSEAEQIINIPDVNTPLGLRDRAILETLYSTGVRRMEVVNLRLYDLDHDRGTLIVRQGKGRKDRMVPIGERALAWIDRYLREVRPTLLSGDSAGEIIFLTKLGEPFSPDQMTTLVREYVDAADIGKKGSCHLWRHTAATLLHDAGADIRFIQAFLGHAKLTTTEIYTQVSIRQLKAIHAACHPSSKLKRQGEPDAEGKKATGQDRNGTKDRHDDQGGAPRPDRSP
jgi:integrase/recombinase XerD